MKTDLEEEKSRRLEKAISEKEKFNIEKEIESREDVIKRKITMAEIKENAWKRRGEKSNMRNILEGWKLRKKKRKEAKRETE